MLKRYQILLNDWLADFMRYRAEKYDTSFSECVRVALCMYYLVILPQQYPEYKSDLSPDDIKEMVKKYLTTPHDLDEMHSALSKVYFEARKAMEYALKKDEESCKS